MHKPLPLLASVLILLGLLGHHLHHPMLPDYPAPAAVQVTASAPGVAGSALRVVDHDALVDFEVEVCVPGGQVAHMAAAHPGDIGVLPPDVHRDVVDPAPSVVSAWLVPSLPPDVLRAFLQVFLN